MVPCIVVVLLKITPVAGSVMEVTRPVVGVIVMLPVFMTFRLTAAEARMAGAATAETAASLSVPAEITVAPAYVLAAVRFRVPAPILVRPGWRCR